MTSLFCNKSTHFPSEIRSMKTMTILITVVVAVLMPTDAFVHTPSFRPRAFNDNVIPKPLTGITSSSSSSSKSNPLVTSKSVPSSVQLSMSFDDVSSFYSTYPLQAAVLTCGVKASLADCVAQIQNWSKTDRAIELKRNVAYILYGGIFIGLFCHIEYDIIFPHIFGAGNHDIKTVAEEVLFDNFISAPLLWLPPAYIIKAFMFDYPIKEGLQRYITDIEEGLLMKYWAIWLPAQTISFSIIPDQFRIVFMAMISFGWFILLSSSQSKTDAAADMQLAEQE